MLPDARSEEGVRMKWFRIFDSGRENQADIAA
jgi:hypothetical protein